MDVTDLPPGTKLMWDAPEPYAGYAKERYDREDGRVVYPLVVTSKKKKAGQEHLTHIRSMSNAQWMQGEQPYVRRPTQYELDNLRFPPEQKWS